jgi:DNA replication protein DnaC
MDRNISQIDPSIRKTFRALVTGETPWPLLLLGGAGVGKTCAALCLCDYAHSEYLTVPDLLEQMIRCQNGAMENVHGYKMWPDNFWSQISSKSVCVLDELGSREKISDHHYETVKRFCDARHGLPTVYISNLNQKQIAAIYDDRIFSRLNCGTVLEVTGKDRRLLN